jgi:exosortase A
MRIWWVSEIYSHGFFVIPLSAYLVWKKKSELFYLPIRLSYYPIPLIVVSIITYIIGVAGDIKLFQHIGVFSMLPLTLWLGLGNEVSKVIVFPLAFMLFAIPFGEEFIPILQQITADISVSMLKAIGIPIYRNGLYIEIPNGRFIVAEACSGIRFFVGATVFGALYAYIIYRDRIKQYIFFVFAMVTSIIANSIRVSVIILIGYFSDMQYATGADHLIYGWLFFAIIIILLILIGNRWADNNPKRITKEKNEEIEHGLKGRTLLISLMSVIAIYFLLQIWHVKIINYKEYIIKESQTTGTVQMPVLSKDWSPEFLGASDVVSKKYLDKNSRSIEYYNVYYKYNTPNSELISSMNRIFDPKAWTVKSASVINIYRSNKTISAQMLYLAGANGNYRLIIYWYEVNNIFTYNKIIAKIYQTLDILTGNRGSGRIVIYSTQYSDEEKDDTSYQLINFTKNHTL